MNAAMKSNATVREMRLVIMGSFSSTEILLFME